MKRMEHIPFASVRFKGAQSFAKYHAKTKQQNVFSYQRRCRNVLFALNMINLFCESKCPITGRIDEVSSIRPGMCFQHGASFEILSLLRVQLLSCTDSYSIYYSLSVSVLTGYYFNWSLHSLNIFSKILGSFPSV